MARKDGTDLLRVEKLLSRSVGLTGGNPVVGKGIVRSSRYPIDLLYSGQ